MTNTLGSIMALINDAINTAEKAEADHCSPMGSPSFRQSNSDAREAEAALRLAIREVLAERDKLLDIIRREAWLEIADTTGKESPYVPFNDWVAEKNRAERAEAEVARLKAGGCARDQGLTQYCAEAAALAKLAADELERLTPTEEDRKAAQYLAKYYERNGAVTPAALLRKYVLGEKT